MKTLLLLLNKPPYAGKFYFSVCFLSSFVFFDFGFWTIETANVNLLGLAHSNPTKCNIQVTLSNEHKKYLF